ncbi:MAG TPA: preprotein translocase subunit SecE [Pyrinomonadaceae bacterium]|nr:preprotein translocase subunit SecE [Pyrinomonadaceae bacterium]
MARQKDDEFENEDDKSLPSLEPTPPPGRTSSSGVEAGAGPAPRAARFGEGPEGRGARRERGVAGAREGFFGRIATFGHDVRGEMRRVSWPNFKDVQNTTIITIIAVAFFATYLWLIDKGWTLVINGLTKVLGG